MAAKAKPASEAKKHLYMFLIPCSCGSTFAVSEGFDRHGTDLRSFLPCPDCGKRHDPRNRLLRLDYQEEQFWKIAGC
jgi:hydrogenase maturation factor HypF (carbamoyltransferase family)